MNRGLSWGVVVVLSRAVYCTRGVLWGSLKGRLELGDSAWGQGTLTVVLA